MMKLGFGFYRHMLNPDYFAFAKQVGATHAVVHLVDYFNKSASNARRDQPVGGLAGWGYAGDPEKLWTLVSLLEIKRQIEGAGLIWEAIENFDPAHWSDILLDGPRKKQQIDGIKTMIERVGEAGVPIIGYNFSLAGVAGRVTGPFARGGAISVGMNGPLDSPVPNGMVWNMIYDPDAPAGFLPETTHEQLWMRVAEFLNECLPAAEQAGVRLAAHPDDPPMPFMRGQPRLVYRPDLYQKLIDLNPSRANQLEFCAGTIAEMQEGDIYNAVDKYSAQERIAYVHLRNVRGKVPYYKETHIDEGDIDVLRVLRILKKNNFAGLIIPDHAPQLTCEAPWHAGMAFAMGFLQAGLKTVEAENACR
jgi:mannonate dehydratase